jgi:hypothetical protein
MEMKIEQAQQTKAEMIFDVLEANRLLNAPPVEADEVQAGRRIADFVYDAMRVGGLRVQDSGVVLVCMNKRGKLERPAAYAVENGDTQDQTLLDDITTRGLQPVGIVISILDRERRRLMLHSEVFEGMEESKVLMREALEIIELRHRAGDPKHLN